MSGFLWCFELCFSFSSFFFFLFVGAPVLEAEVMFGDVSRDGRRRRFGGVAVGLGAAGHLFSFRDLPWFLLEQTWF